MNNCKNCEYGPGPDPMSDICDGCRNDPDTGWGGFTDHSIGKHFNSDEEAKEYYENHFLYDDESFDNY
jgi:hypothetical protein